MFSFFPKKTFSKNAALLLSVATLASSISAPARAANFLEEIFSAITGGNQTMRAPVIDPRIAAAAARRRAAERAAAQRRHTHATLAVNNGGGSYGVYGKMQALAPEAGVEPGSIQHFAADPTLRAGDVIVTSTGFMVYKGGSQGFAAFSPVSKAKPSLSELERASQKSTGGAWSNAAPLAVSKPLMAQEADVVGQTQAASAPADAQSNPPRVN